MALHLRLAAVPLESAADHQHGLHRRLAHRNQQRLRPSFPEDRGRTDPRGEAEQALDARLEERFVSTERAAVEPMLAEIPTTPDQFVAWFESLAQRGPGQNDPLFPWLARHCTLAEMRWFLGQEVAGEAGFEDLLALTQLRMPTQAKLEMARNYWDEMGLGGEAGMHGPMLDRLADALSVRLPIDEITWPSLALGNLMVALAWNRHYAYQAVGALGVIELTAPGRAVQVNEGLRRLGVPPATRKYFAVHATLDVKHSAAWNREVLRPLVAAEPRAARAIGEGALLRLRAGARCFEAYRACACAPVPPVSVGPKEVTASPDAAAAPRRW